MDGVAAGLVDNAAFEIADQTRTQAGTLRQLLLGEIVGASQFLE
jgi:hypothetical protein